MEDEAVFSRYIPEDVISNILLRLPIRSLIVCTAVSKPWNSFIKSPAFFSSHLEHTISNRKEKDPDLCLLQLCSVPVDTGTDTFFLRSKDRDLSEYGRVHFPFPPDEIGYQVLASCNGLFYLMHGRLYENSCSYEWMLWNPAIRKTLVITEHQNEKVVEAIGLGFDLRTGDYKLLSIVEEPFRNDNLRVNLYSLKANSWKRLPDLDYVNIRNATVYREMAFVNGALHFVALRAHFVEPRFVISGFNVADERFNEIMLPDCIANDFSDYYVSTCGESLSVLRNKRRDVSNIEIWVMKEYGVEGSWTKVSTVRLDSSFDRRDLSISGLVFKDDSHVLFGLGSHYYGKTAGRIFSHDLNSQETNEIRFDGKNTCYYLGNYAESLVLLDEPKERPPEVERGISFLDGFLESRGLNIDENGVISEIDPLSALFLGCLEKVGLPVPGYEQPFEVESDDGDDASATSSSYGDLGDEETAENGPIPGIDSLNALYLSVLEETGLRVPGYDQPFEVESDDGDDTSASSSSYDIGSLFDRGDLGDDGSDASAGSSSYGVGSLYDHGELGDEETADIEGDSGERDSSSHASEE